MNIRTQRPWLRARAYVHAEALYRRTRRFPHQAVAELLSEDERRAIMMWGELEWHLGIGGKTPIGRWRRILVAPLIKAARAWVNE